MLSVAVSENCGESWGRPRPALSVELKKLDASRAFTGPSSRLTSGSWPASEVAGELRRLDVAPRPAVLSGSSAGTQMVEPVPVRPRPSPMDGSSGSASPGSLPTGASGAGTDPAGNAVTVATSTLPPAPCPPPSSSPLSLSEKKLRLLLTKRLPLLAVAGEAARMGSPLPPGAASGRASSGPSDSSTSLTGSPVDNLTSRSAANSEVALPAHLASSRSSRRAPGRPSAFPNPAPSTVSTDSGSGAGCKWDLALAFALPLALRRRRAGAPSSSGTGWAGPQGLALGCCMGASAPS
mmetsp:Transcript_30877/g.91742  ORF Transcript_30877/g.91742 Transcript_30877/m.91742 type:complete len:294 (-) Transcript_30877:41-922(-)